MRKFSLMLAILICFGEVAFAAAAGGAAMPWEGPLQTIKNSLTGPVAGYIALIAIMICGAILIFGGDISGFARNLVNVVLACAVILGASSIITNLFPAAGAVIKVERLHDHDLQAEGAGRIQPRAKP